MPRFRVSRLLPVAVALLLAACGGSSTSTSVTGPTSNPSSQSSSTSSSCSAGVSGLPGSVSANGGRFPFTITAASGCTWTARADAAWGDVTPAAGQGNGSPTLTIDQNTSRDSRTLTVTVNGQGTRIVQSGSTCSYAVDRTSVDAGAEGGTLSIALTTSSDCGWTATSSEGWIRVLTPSGTGNASVQFELAANTGDVRRAYVTIGGRRVDIIQERR